MCDSQLIEDGWYQIKKKIETNTLIKIPIRKWSFFFLSDFKAIEKHRYCKYFDENCFYSKLC